MSEPTEEEQYAQFQEQLKERQFCIGWHPVDSQKKTYYDAIYDSWHEANEIAKGLQNLSFVFFVEAVTDTKDCPKCKGTGKDPEDEVDCCGHCHGKGRIRA